MYKTSWDLQKYFYKSIDDENLNKDIQIFLEKVDNFVQKYKWKIKSFTFPKQLYDFYKDEENLGKEISKVFHYLFYLSSLDSQNQAVIKKLLEVENIYNQAQEKLLFVDEEFKYLFTKQKVNWVLFKNILIEELNKPNSVLAPYKYHILHKIKTLKYLLSSKEEKLITKFSPISSQVENLYDEYHNWLVFEIFLDWKKKKLPEEEIRALRSHKDEKIRKRAYESLRKTYSQRETRVVLSNLYSTFVKEWTLNVKLRWYKSVIQPRNISEDMDDKVVDMLINQVKDNYFLFQRYINLKAKLLGKKLPLAVRNVLAPVSDSTKEFSFKEALEIHLNVMKTFDKDFYDYSLDLLKNWRVDVFPKVWKRGGAFASYSKGQESFVLLNFTKKLNDIFTLSHEFWHAIHWWLSQVQPEQVYDSPLSLAETASIFNEMLLSNYLLSSPDLSKEDKIYLLEHKLNDIFATIFRQIQYVDFELEVHNLILNWQQLSYEDYCKIWRKTQLRMSWNVIKYDVDESNENSWSMIPHIFHTPFYCYSYAFWNILVFSLFDMYKKQWKKFVNIYKEILKSGWSMPPKELLLKYWIDITKKSFYKNAFNQIKLMLDELEKLINF